MFSFCFFANFFYGVFKFFSTEPQAVYSTDAMVGLSAGADGDAELGSGVEHKRDGPEMEGAHGQMELDALCAFVEAGLHNVDARVEQQVDTLP